MVQQRIPTEYNFADVYARLRELEARANAQAPALFQSSETGVVEATYPDTSDGRNGLLSVRVPEEAGTGYTARVSLYRTGAMQDNTATISVGNVIRFHQDESGQAWAYWDGATPTLDRGS